MNASGIYNSKIGEVWASVCQSGLITRLFVLQDRLLASGVGVGPVWSRSPYVVTPQIKKMKVSVVLWRQMDAVTHTTCAKSRARRQADTWLQIRCHQTLEGRDVCWMCVSCCCVRLYNMAKSMWTTVNNILCNFAWFKARPICCNSQGLILLYRYYLLRI